MLLCAVRLVAAARAGRDPRPDSGAKTIFSDLFLPSPGHLAGIAGVLLVVLCFSVIGRAVAGGRMESDGDVLFGWAAVAALFTVVGALRLASFTAIAVTVLLLALAAALWMLSRRQAPVDGALPRVAAIALPLILLVGAMAPSQWDEFTNWLPSARYLLEQDGFPAAGLPPNPSVFPAYPYGLPLVAYLASRVAGHLVENAIALFNLVLLLGFGLLLARIVRGALSSPTPDMRLPHGLAAPEDIRLGWGWCAFGALLATGLNPTFVPKVVFTAYADTATAVGLGFAAAFAWRLLNALADGDDARARAAALRLGLAGVALVATKQVNLVLVVSLALTVAVIALRDPALAFRALLRPAIVALGPPLALYAAWRVYVSFNMVGGEFTIRPPSGWTLELIPDVLAGMAGVAAKKGGYFGLMLVAVGFAVRALRAPRGAFDRLAMIAAGMFVAYNGFLLFAYIAAFGADDAVRVGSYWRYNMHLGGVALLFAAYGGALLWRRHVVPRWRPRLAWLAILLAVATPIALAGKLRFDLHPRYVYARATGTDVARMLTPADRLALIDPEDDGQYLVIMRYAMHGSAAVATEVTAYVGGSADRLRAALDTSRASHAWLYRPLPAIEAATGARLDPGSSYLLRREGAGWTVLRRWPHPRSGR